MSVFGTIASACAPIMTTVAFGVLEGVEEFETSTAFTTMFVF